MQLIVFLAGIFTIISFLVAIGSFILHFCHHFEFHDEFKIARCCCKQTAPHASHPNLDHIGQLQNAHPIQNWSRQVSQRTMDAAAFFADEVKQNNCGCCHIMRQSNVHKDQLFCCLYSSVAGIEFYPLAVTLYFLLLISVITFTSVTLYSLYYKQYILSSSSFNEWIASPLQTHNMQQYCNIQDHFDDVRHTHLYNTSPIASMKQTDIRLYVAINYILVMFLLQWESLLNWYRFYSTKYMSLRFTRPPYLKIFGFFFIYTVMFLLLCVAQMYIAFLLFPVIILIHIIFNSCCVVGFMKVLNLQYQHYVAASQGVAPFIITDLRNTMKKLKSCALWSILSSSLFLLTLTFCRFGDMVLLSAPLWWIINCICWMLTFAKNTIWFRHKRTHCVHICCKHCCGNQAARSKPGIIRKTSKELDRERRLESRRHSKNKILSHQRPLPPVDILPTLLEVGASEEEKEQSDIITPAISWSARDVHLPNVIADRDDSADSDDDHHHTTTTPHEEEEETKNENDTETDLSSCAQRKETDQKIEEESVDACIKHKETDTATTDTDHTRVSSIRLPTILDNQEHKHSPMGLTTISAEYKQSPSDLATINTEYKPSPLETPQRSDTDKFMDTPMSIIVTPAGEPPLTEMPETLMYRANSSTYQYPADYDDVKYDNTEDVNAMDEYFKFPSADLDVEVSITRTQSRLPKALSILGVTECDEQVKGKSKRSILNFMSSGAMAFETPHQHLPCLSSEDEMESPSEPAIGPKQTSTSSFKDSPSRKAIKAIKAIYPIDMQLSQRGGISGDKSHRRQRSQRSSKTMSYEASQVLWGLIVGNGMVSSKTIRSLNELEEYTIAASPAMKPQSAVDARQTCDLFDVK